MKSKKRWFVCTCLTPYDPIDCSRPVILNQSDLPRNYQSSLQSKMIFLVSSLYLVNAEVKPLTKHVAWWPIINKSTFPQREVFSVSTWTLRKKTKKLCTNCSGEALPSGVMDRLDERFIIHELEFIVWFPMKGTFLLLSNTSSLGSHVI